MFYIIRTICVITYLITFIYGIKLFIMPLINMYGFWGFVGYWAILTFVGFLCGFFFMAAPKSDPTPPTPMATYKEQS